MKNQLADKLLKNVLPDVVLRLRRAFQCLSTSCRSSLGCVSTNGPTRIDRPGSGSNSRSGPTGLLAAHLMCKEKLLCKMFSEQRWLFNS